MSIASVAKESHTLTLTWDVELDTNDTSTCEKIPLATRFGKVELEITVPEPQTIKPIALFEDVLVGSMGHNVSVSASMYWLNHRDEATLIQTGTWPTYLFFPPNPPKPSGLRLEGCTPAALKKAADANHRFDRFSHDRFRFSFILTFNRPTSPTSPCPPLTPEKIKTTMSTALLSKRPNDLRLFFPHLGAELWTNSSVLASLSPYFKTLLASDAFSESIRRGRKRARNDAAGESELVVDALKKGSSVEDGTGHKDLAEATDEQDEQDSDEECDAFIKRNGAPSVENAGDDGDFTYREVKITETPYSTYRAVLLYLHSGHITFAPLSSALLPRNPDAQHSRQQLLDKHLDSMPSLPLPVSPKSVYRLAHLLEIPSLCAFALEGLKTQLRVQNAAVELFSPTSLLYPDLRTAILDFVVPRLPEIKETDEMQEIDRKVIAEELPSAAPVYAEMLTKLIGKKGRS